MHTAENEECELTLWSRQIARALGRLSTAPSAPRSEWVAVGLVALDIGLPLVWHQLRADDVPAEVVARACDLACRAMRDAGGYRLEADLLSLLRRDSAASSTVSCTLLLAGRRFEFIPLSEVPDRVALFVFLE